ncbi:hypothetical protein BKA63DRAFT_316204 [Paraphoma chrysanthemicola]|nr:hypothetical protein BKA63DRAFT_316204 [Paraphoma chrysanthemicola]
MDLNLSTDAKVGGAAVETGHRGMRHGFAAVVPISAPTSFQPLKASNTAMVQVTGPVAVNATLDTSQPSASCKSHRVTSLISPSAATVLIISTRFHAQRRAFLPRHGGGYGRWKVRFSVSHASAGGLHETRCICWRRSLHSVAAAGPPWVRSVIIVAPTQLCSVQSVSYFVPLLQLVRTISSRQSPVARVQDGDWLRASSSLKGAPHVCADTLVAAALVRQTLPASPGRQQTPRLHDQVSRTARKTLRPRSFTLVAAARTEYLAERARDRRRMRLGHCSPTLRPRLTDSD